MELKYREGDRVMLIGDEHGLTDQFAVVLGGDIAVDSKTGLEYATYIVEVEPDEDDKLDDGLREVDPDDMTLIESPHSVE